MDLSLYCPNHKEMKTSIFIPAILFLASLNAFSQPALNIFLDCGSCDMNYFKTNFTAVNYVNDAFDADVHILVSGLPTGGGGTEYSIRLVGQGQFKSMQDTVYAVMPEYYTDDETRQALLDRIRLGLVPYLLKTPYGEKLTLFIDDSPVTVEQEDPWKNWVFDITGSGSVARQKYSRSYSLSGNLYISKITENIKIESSNYFGFSESKYDYFSDDTLATYTMSQQDITSENLIVKSFGNHWGLGGFASLGKSEYANLDFQFNIGPAVEYNIFSYEEASSRECRFMYSINYEHSRYNDLTIYNKTQDDLFSQNLGINFSYYQPWGTISASAGASSYLNDLSQFSAWAGVTAYLRIFKGLSLTLSGSAGYTQDQRSLRQGVGDITDIVTGQWQMEQGFSYSLNAGLSYRFGSKSNNAVNPRFGY
jgi:hypothetical protein